VNPRLLRVCATTTVEKIKMDSKDAQPRSSLSKKCQQISHHRRHYHYHYRYRYHHRLRRRRRRHCNPYQNYHHHHHHTITIKIIIMPNLTATRSHGNGVRA
jgi:hypothetical protein